MERAIRWAWLVFLAVIITTALPPAWGVNPVASAAAAQTVNAGYLENVAFERLPGKERVILTVSKQSGVTVENQPGNAVLVRMENLFVPEGLRRPLSDAALANVVRVTPDQKTAEGRSWVIATIDLKQKVPYSVRQEGMNILIDFNVTSVAAAEPAPEKPLPVVQIPAARTAEKSATPGAKNAREVAGNAGKETKAYGGPRISLDVQDADIKAVFRLLAEQGNVSIVSGDDVKGTVTLKMKDVSWEQALNTILGIKGLSKIEKDNVIMVMTNDSVLKLKKAEEEAVKKEKKQTDTEPLITRVVQVKYRMLTMVKTSKIDVKGEVIATSSREPAADGSVLSAPQKEDFAGGASVAGTKTQKVAMEGAGDFFALLQSLLSVDSEGKQRGWIGADADTNSLIITAIKSDMIKIMDMISKIDIPTEQILIKANIVETTKTTARDLGIQWGGAYGRNVGSQSLYLTPGGKGGSTVPPGSALSGGYTPTSGVTGVGGQGYGVNFPATSISTTASASLGLLFGTIGGNILDVQLSALQKDGKMNILSSPSITTLDNQMAFTENGLIVPYATTESSGGTVTRSIKKEEATLRLEIVPHVIDGQKLKMKIVVKKNEVDFTAGHSVDGNPYIIKKQTETNLIVNDGETVVISGFTKQKTQDGNSGLPWFKDVPVLGWLFKADSKSEEMEEVLIFITPNIVKSQIVSGIQEGA